MGAIASGSRPKLAAFGAVISVVALYLWDDALIAFPIVAGVRIMGLWSALAVFSVVYAAGSFGLSLWVVRLYERRAAGGSSRFADWVERQSEGTRSGWIRRLLLSGQVVGFVASSFLLGGIVTTFLIRYSGRTRHLARLAAASSAIFGVTFVGTYSGVGKLAFG